MILINAQKYSDYIKEQLVVEAYFDDYIDLEILRKQTVAKLTLRKNKIAAFCKKAKFISKQEATELAKNNWV